jgi:predicted nucleic acid-binding protein
VIVLDASVLIAHLDATDVHHTRAAEALLVHAPQGFGASPITLAEVLVGPIRRERLEAAWAALQDLGVGEVPWREDACRRLAALRALTSLKLPDCCVLLAAQDARAHSIVTFDERLLQSARELGLVRA